MTKKFWTGVGSRETPIEVMDFMVEVAFKLAQDGWILRSGGADGADTAFEQGARRALMDKQPDIYIPWWGFNNCNEKTIFKCLKSFTLEKTILSEKIASEIHPAWEKLSNGAKALHTRNVFQVMGDDLNDPSKFLICWAKMDKSNTPIGGTRTAWVLAKQYGVPCYNLYNEEDYHRINEWLIK